MERREAYEKLDEAWKLLSELEGEICDFMINNEEKDFLKALALLYEVKEAL